MRRGAMARLAVAARAFSASASGTGADGVSRGIGLEFAGAATSRRSARARFRGRAPEAQGGARARPPHRAAARRHRRREHHRGSRGLNYRDPWFSTSLDLLINSTGILSIPNVIQPETTLSKVQKSSMMLAHEVNAIGLSEKINNGIRVVNEKVKSGDQRLQVSDKTMATLLAAERKLNDIGSPVKTNRSLLFHAFGNA